MKKNYTLRVNFLLSMAACLFAWCANAQAPANDDCAGAVVLTVNPDFSCAVATQSTTVGATETMDQGVCYGNPDDDVWFSFEATSDTHSVSLIDITAVEGDSEDMYFEVLEGTCDGLTSVYCSDYDFDMVENLIPGTIYYIRVYSYYDDSRQTFKICLGTMPGPPANDDCSGAIAVTVNPDFSCTSKTAGTTIGATNSMEADPCNGDPDDDVWFTFVATATSHRIELTDIEPFQDWDSDMYFQVLEGTCDGTMTSLLCSDPEENMVNDLTPGNTYFVRVYSYYDTYQDFNICIGTPPDAPANDDCLGAVTLTVNPTLDCVASVTGTTLSATESQQANCLGDPDDDVWYKFTATSTRHLISLTDIEAETGWSTDMYFEVFDGGTCDGLISKFCSDNDTDIVAGLTPNDVYYVRVYSYGSDDRQSFTICVSTLPAAPANDECTAATALIVNTGLECTAVTAGTTLGASESMEADPCSGNPDDDVWFSFIATAESHRVVISDIEDIIGGSTDMYFQVLEGTCGTMTSLKCSDADSTVLTGLTVNSTYYIRVYSYSSATYQTFNICVSTMPGTPANDDCDGAIALTVNPNLDCGAFTSASTVGATESGEENPCYGNADDDVWFSFEATADTHIVSLFDTEDIIGEYTDLYIEVLSGTCGALQSVECESSEDFTLTDLTPGDTYFVRIFTYDENEYSSFKICVGTIPPPPANDDCEGAIALTAGGTFDTNAIIVSNGGATDTPDVEDPNCASYDGQDVWCSVVVPASGNITVETKRNPSSSLTDTGLAIYSGVCGNLELEDCNDDNDDDDETLFSKLQLTGRTPGEILYIRLWEYGSNAYGSFRVSAYDATLSSEDFTSSSITHYPNPVQDILNISYTSDITSVTVYNMLGQQVLSAKPATSEAKVDMSALTDGPYIVNVTSGNAVKTIKVIKKQ